MSKLRNWLNNRMVQITALATAYMPLIAHADWGDDVNAEARKARIALYLICGTVGVGTMVWKGINLLLARANGDHSVTLMDYLKQCCLVGLVAASVPLGVWAWNFFGSGATA